MNVTALPKPTELPPIQTKSPKKRAQKNDVMPRSKAGRRRCIARDPTEAVPAARETKKNSPSRWRFRPPPRGTVGFRLEPPGAASTYSRSVLGATGKLVGLAAGGKCVAPAVSAICENFRNDRAK